MTLRVAVTIVCAVVSGCASAQTAFRPYSPTSDRAAVVEEAIEASRSDLRALAAAGAVIVGSVTARGNGFAGAQFVRDAAAREAARHGGTHFVLGMSVLKSARGQRLSSSGSALQGDGAQPKYYPGRTIELTALVLRLSDEADPSALPPELRPPGQLIARHAPPPAAEQRPTPAPSERAPQVAGTPPAPIPPENTATSEPVDIDGSHIQPLPLAGE